MNLGWYYHTVRYLKPGQIARRLVPDTFRGGPDLRAAPIRRRFDGTWVTPARRRPSMLAPGQVRFLNVDGELTSPGDWNRDDREALWLYNLHYFDDLNAFGADERDDWHEALVDRWILENPPGEGVGWQPYPLSLRLVNWIKWMLGSPGRAHDDRLHSLAVQARWLRGRLEKHLLGNHLFSNAKALAFAGALFEGNEARGWLDTAFQILSNELREQILPDGGQFERSPMYHALALEDMLDLVNLSRVAPAAFESAGTTSKTELERTACRMGLWLRVMCHPDGELSFFNDAAFGIAPALSELERYATELGIVFPSPEAPLHVLRESGYARCEQGSAVALLDVAPVGPDYLPGHAHADTLSFELSVDGRRVVVNGGTSVYGTGPERQRQRGTAAHSTVVVDGENSSEVWAGFRVARRASPFGLESRAIDDGVEVGCSHDGYRRLRGRCTHSRRWRMRETSMSVQDEVSGRYGTAIARFHLHPAVKVSREANGELQLTAPGMRRVKVVVSRGDATVVDETWHPEFGLSMNSRCIDVRLTGNRSEVSFRWA